MTTRPRPGCPPGDRGASAVEYALLVALVAMLIVFPARGLLADLGAAFSHATSNNLDISETQRP